jgi:hypothetical protein
MSMVFVPHRKHLWAAKVCYGDSFTFLYVDDIRDRLCGLVVRVRGYSRHSSIHKSCH